MEKKPFVVDVDGHVTEPTDLWQKYLESEYRARAPRMIKTDKGVEGLFVENKPCIELLWGIFGLLSGIGHKVEELYEAGRYPYNHPAVTHPGSYDGKARIDAMDKQGLDMAFIYPTLSLFWDSEVEDFKLAAACARAYNRWAWDFCQNNPERMKPVAHIHLGDVNEAVKEVKRVAKEGFPGVFISPKQYNGHPYPGDPYYDPFWAAAQECNLPVGIHITFPQTEATWAGSGYPATGFPSFAWWFLQNRPMIVQQSFSTLFTLGTLAKFPDLRVLVVEATGSWITNFLERLDSKYKFVGHAEVDLKMLPSEVFKRNCWISMDADEESVRDIVPTIGADKILFASDFPHSDGCERPVEETKEALTGLSDDALSRILGGNAMDAYSGIGRGSARSKAAGTSATESRPAV
jgi:predicted TIM-barrel fold metal-dependent hydrolase